MKRDLYVSKLNDLIHSEQARMNECHKKISEWENMRDAAMRSKMSLEDARDMYIQMCTDDDKDGTPDE